MASELEISAIIISVVALVFAFVQFRDAKSHTRSLGNLIKDLEGIKSDMSNNLVQLSSDLAIMKGSLSTKFLSAFPDFIEDIVSLINNAESELTILCDFPAYSYFSDYPGWIKYHGAINNQTDKDEPVSATIICLSPEKLRERIKEQFLNENSSLDESWAACFSSNRFQKNLSHFIKRHDKSLHNKGISNYTEKDVPLDRFIDLSIDVSNDILKSEFLNTELLETTSQMSMFCWIADNKMAIFAIPRSEVGGKELGFKTTDEKLILALKSIVKGYKINAAPFRK